MGLLDREFHSKAFDFTTRMEAIRMLHAHQPSLMRRRGKAGLQD